MNVTKKFNLNCFDKFTFRLLEPRIFKISTTNVWYALVMRNLLTYLSYCSAAVYGLNKEYFIYKKERMNFCLVAELPELSILICEIM